MCAEDGGAGNVPFFMEYFQIKNFFILFIEKTFQCIIRNNKLCTHVQLKLIRKVDELRI